MPKRRNKEHKGLPRGWRYKHGAYSIRVPVGQEHLWDGKKEFRLGATLSEAHRVYANRIASADGAITTIAQLIDRYLVEVTPTKARRTQKDEVKYLTNFRKLIGENDVASFKPHHAYAIRDHIKSGVTKGTGEKQANRHMSALKHVFTKSIEWGLRETHPMHNGVFKMFPEKKSKMRIPTEEEVREAIKIANPMLQAYCKLKLLTGLRLTDMLSLTVGNITADGLVVTPRKTEDRTDVTISFVMTDELKAVLKEVRSVPPLNSIYLFTNHRRNRGVGEALIKPDGTTTGFDSQWQRWQQKLPKEKRFAERSLRNLVGSEDDLQTASERLGHASTATTKKFYRNKPTVVLPLPHKNIR